MVDIVEPHDAFTLARYLDRVHAVAREVTARDRPMVFVGGTPLYLRGLLYGIFEGPGADWSLRAQLMERARVAGSAALHKELMQVDPVTAERLHPNDLVRIVRALEVVRGTGRRISELQRQYPASRPAVAYRMVALRRLEADLRRRIEERTDRMFAAGLVAEVRQVLRQGGFSRPARKAIGYREVLAHLGGEMSLGETVERVKRNTWRLARKQRMWLKSFPGVRWLDVRSDERPEETAVRARDLLFGREMLN